MSLNITFGGVLSPDGVFCRLSIALGIELSESSDSSLLKETRSANRCSGLRENKDTKEIYVL